jgi:hypothetical protein
MAAVWVRCLAVLLAVLVLAVDVVLLSAERGDRTEGDRGTIETVATPAAATPSSPTPWPCVGLCASSAAYPHFQTDDAILAFTLAAYDAPGAGTVVPLADDPTPTAELAEFGADGAACDAAYPDFCIPPSWLVGDLDCADIAGWGFTVRSPDAHRLDPDVDGIGCE